MSGVICGGEVGDVFEARANTRSCSLTVSSVGCQVLHYSTGSQIRTALYLDNDDVPDRRDLNFIYYDCVVSHELRHLCDGPGVRICKTEENAFRTSHRCFQDYYSKYCATGGDKAFCDNIRANITDEAVGAYVNQCACAGRGERACVDECATNWPRQKCQSKADAYFPIANAPAG
jgi:hypothetical protein